jgi:hypothetical protein
MDPHFYFKAAEKERAFFRKYWKQGYTLHTVKEKRPNTIQKVTEKYVYVTTEKSRAANRIPRDRLRKALAILFYRRVVTLKELIKINSFSSALAALIKAIMADICKVMHTKKGAVRLTLRGLRFIFSGLSKGRNDMRFVSENGGRFVLLNYHDIRFDTAERWKQKLLELGLKCVLDSGEFSRYNAELKGKRIKPITVEDYAQFVMRHSDVIYQYFTLDKIGDPEVTKRNFEYLERVVRKKPIPIWHVQNSLDLLQELVDAEHEVIAIGGSRFVSRQKREAVFDAIFQRFGDRANFHALGLGATDLLLRHNWFSADASTWLNGRIFRKLISIAGEYPAPKWMSNEEALAFNVRTLAALEDRYSELQIDISMLPPC